MSEQSLPNFDTMWNYGDPVGTEKRFREILPEAELSHDAEYHAQLLTQIARCQSLQGRFIDSHETLDTVAQMLSSYDLKLARVRYLLERGRAFNSSGKPDVAAPLFEQAHSVAMGQQNIHHAIDAVHMVAIAKSDPRDQIEWNRKGIAMTDEYPSGRGWLHALLNNIGESYLRIEDYQNAYDSFHRLSELQREKRGSVDMYTLKDEAKALRLLGQPQRSLDMMQPIMENILAGGKDDGYIRQELAEDLYALGRTDEARSHFAKGYALLSQDSWAMENEADKVERMKELSK